MAHSENRDVRTCAQRKRGFAYLSVAVFTSVSVGVAATAVSDAWETVSPLTAGYFGLLGFGPMSIVLSLAPVSRVVSFGFSVLLALAVAVSWVAFASDNSSTSALVFMWGWIAGIPLAAAVVAVTNAHSSR